MRLGDKLTVIHKLIILLIIIILGTIAYCCFAQYYLAKHRYLERHRIEAAEEFKFELI